MSIEYNIYCDESCHLENDGHNAMVLGAIKCSKEQRQRISKEIKAIKVRHKLPSNFEIKWTKVSKTKLSFYLELINYFFNTPELTFRGLIVPDKSKLNHSQFNNTHDDFYYKMYFLLLNQMLENHNKYNVYIDIKDTQGSQKVEKLQDVLASANYDFNREMIQKIQQVHSHEVEHLQLADLIIGALGYINRELDTSTSKLEIIERIKKLSGLSLTKNTLLSAKKFNLFIWDAK
ncbi:MAG: DUF3800 domain-containing protein [Epsilonproteobacteria bacterium]|nr:MAG: DUF3800 domain-containing protein [Campylobacterota bacterium]